MVEFLAAFAGIIYYKKYKASPVKYFIYFLLLVAIFDTLCYYTHYVRPNKALSFLIGTKFEKNHWLPNIYWSVGAVLFFAFYYYTILKTPLLRAIIRFLAFLFFIFSIIYIGLNWDAFFYSFFIGLDVAGAIVVLTCTIFYFIEILESDKILHFYKSINFWISVIVFVWWLIITPLTFYDVYYRYEVGKAHFDMDFLMLRKQIFLFANIIMYITFTFAFIWCRPKND